MQVRTRGWLVLAVVLMALALPVTGRAQSLSDRDIVTAFDMAAFGPASRTGASLYRWDGAVRFRVAGESPERYRRWVEAQLAALSDLTGLDMRRVDTIDADVVVVFVPSFRAVTDGAYNNLLDRYVSGAERRESLLAGYRQAGAVCAGQVNARGSALVGGIVFVPLDRMAPVVHACVAAQLTRVIGLPFALASDLPSVLATDSPWSHLSELDRMLVRMLYHPRMSGGLRREDARIVAQSVLPEIKATSE
ncbi:MAG: DUF2927 domain-containing protein [Pseudomonadota bacterium]|nr:DUF2927 domain-containing protein [Pseudomonadota bacterium]